MKIKINGEDRVFTENELNLQFILETLSINSESVGIAVAHNSSIVKRLDWEKQPLQDGDSIEIVHARQGG